MAKEIIKAGPAVALAIQGQRRVIGLAAGARAIAAIVGLEESRGAGHTRVARLIVKVARNACAIGPNALRDA